MNTSYTDRAEYYIFSRTALNFAYWKLFCTPSSMSRTKSFDTQIDLVKQQTLIHEKPVFTFFYTDIVHGPWAFDENGNSLPDDEMGYKWENPEYYIGHVKYCNAKLAPMLREIIVNDPECVIIIQSDHSFRGIYHTDILNGNTSIDADAENKYMSNIFNAVYYKGEEYDIEGLSMVNTPIKILNDEFDEDIPYTEDVFIARPLDD